MRVPFSLCTTFQFSLRFKLAFWTMFTGATEELIRKRRKQREGKKDRFPNDNLLNSPSSIPKTKSGIFFFLNNVLYSLTSHLEKHERASKRDDPNHRVPLKEEIQLFWTLTIKGSGFPNYMNYVKSLRIALPPQDSLHFRSLHKSSHGESDAKCLIQILLDRSEHTFISLGLTAGWVWTTILVLMDFSPTL